MSRLINFLKNPYKLFVHLSNKGHFNSMSDEKYLRNMYRGAIGKKLNLKEPKGFNEKLQWLKLHDRRPEYTMMVDKYAVKDYVANKIGAQYIIPTIGVWDDPDDIDFDALPDKFVLKCNHNSGLGMCICTDKSTLDVERTRAELRQGLQQDYYLISREWPYKDVKRRIIAEKFMVDESGTELKDYKLMCFDGKVLCSFVCSDRFSDNGMNVTFFDRDWNVLPFERMYPHRHEGVPKPRNYDKMIELAEILSEGIPFVRVDFYETADGIYFGELTFFPGSGLEPFTPAEWDLKIGELIKLPEKT